MFSIICFKDIAACNKVVSARFLYKLCGLFVDTTINLNIYIQASLFYFSSKCFYLRLYKTAERAKLEGFDLFATTLTVSPHKNAKLINSIGKQIEQELNIQYLESDFKKQDGYLKSINLSKKYNLYRQNYCGCEFSNWNLKTKG